MAWGAGTFMDLLGPERAGALVATGHRRELRRGAPLFMEGDVADRVAVVVDGRLKLSTLSTSGVDAMLGLMGPGELVGELSIFDGSPRTATATALEPTEVVLVSRTEFESFLAREPGAALVLIRQLCDRIRTSNVHRTDVEAGPVSVRLARRLLSMVSMAGNSDEHGSVHIELPVTQEELAAWIGTSREAVARALSVMREQGVLRTARRRIVVDDLRALEQCAR